MQSVKNDLFLRALKGEALERTPLWLMRQAGRYLPEYLEVRREAGSFMNLCRTPELATAVTLQPIDRFSFDAAIIFSDILTVPDAMGLGLSFVEGEGPVFERPIRSAEDIQHLQQADVDRDLRYVVDAIRLTKQELAGRVPLIGFCGSPFTLACYMVEGRGSKTFHKTKALLYESPKLFHQLLEKITLSLIDYLNAQIEAGADALQIFDTWGGMLSDNTFRECSLQYTEKIVASLKANSRGESVPVIGFTKDAPLKWYDYYTKIGVQAVGIDWRHDIADVIAQTKSCAIQGNLDPMILFGSEEAIDSAVKDIITKVGIAPHIFNLGHGIHKDVAPERVAFLVEAVRRHSLVVRQA